MPIRTTLLAAALALATMGVASSCSSPTQPQAGGAPGVSPVVATVDGATLTLSEVDESIAAQLFEARAEAVDRWVNERILEAEARRREVEPSAVLDAVASEGGPIAEAEVTAFFEQNKERMRPGETLDSIAPQIRGYLTQQRRAQAMETLRNAADARVMLDPPRIEVAALGASRGPADAPVTIIEFSDYQCPFCVRAEPTLREVLDRYPDQVRLVYRHFPLDSIHPRARAAAEAANCAGEQDRFWEFHDRLFANPRAMDDQDLRGHAEQLGLEIAAFEACRESEDVRNAVQRDLEDGERAGTTGTPAFYVNGIMLSGARPVEDFVEVIEAELERLGG